MRTTGGAELSEAGTSCRNTLYMRPWLSRATSRTVLRFRVEPPPPGTIVRSTTITPENGAPGTGVRKMPLVFCAQPPTGVARRIGRISQEKPIGAGRERIVTSVNNLRPQRTALSHDPQGGIGASLGCDPS